MTSPAIDYLYRYSRPTSLDERGGLRLATCSVGEEPHPYFFRGQLRRPRLSAELLRTLMQVVQARYHVPAAMLGRILALADPIVTCAEGRLRFEGFSGCCGVYARVDLLPEAVDGELLGRGTTNVDFNAPTVAALAQVREQDRLGLSVGWGEVALETGQRTVVERKVPLPLRWLKGLVEVQACQSRMSPCFELSGVEGWRFLRSLPRMKTNRRATWIVGAGRGLRLSQVESRDGVRVGGLERLRVLEGLAPQARTLRIHGDAVTGASAWELDLEDSRLHVVLSPEVWRGFSGEGQALESLASAAWRRALPRVRATLHWQAVVDLADASASAKVAPDVARDALAALGARGLVGFDLAEGAYFHRELPFDLGLVERLQPRLRDARRLLAEGGVRKAERAADAAPGTTEIYVRSGDVEYRVRLTDAEARCTCPWYAKHAATRGPCKHVLAARLLLSPEESSELPGDN